MIREVYDFLYKAVLNYRHKQYNNGHKSIGKVDLPVISVGSLTMGGAGKTPAVISIARLLISAGIRPVILSRGYGRKSKGMHILDNDRLEQQIQTEMYGDEPTMMYHALQKVAVIVSEKRLTGAKHIRSTALGDVILLDDGFQHRALDRDCDILVFKKDFAGEKAHFFPFGDLRDTPERLPAASLILLEKGAAPEVKRWLGSFAPIQEYRLETTLSGSLAEIQKPVCAFCGIARPKEFFASLLAHKIDIEQFISFHDHQFYHQSILKKLAGMGAATFITTEKDRVKLPRSFTDTHKIVTLNLTFIPESPEQIVNKMREIINLKSED